MITEFSGSTCSLQDLQKGCKIRAADGSPIEVIKVEVQKTKKLLDLQRPGRTKGMWLGVQNCFQVIPIELPLMLGRHVEISNLRMSGKPLAMNCVGAGHENNA